MQIQHYRIASPLDTHFRVGTCEEDRCSAYLNGWRTVVDETTQLGQQQAAYIRSDRTRRHVESSELVDGAARTVFTYGPGQRCFRTHRVPLDRPELYLVEGTGFRRVHSGPDPWVDDLNTNQDRLSRLINRG